MRGSGLYEDPRADGRMTTRFFPRDEYFMRLALREAERSLEHDDVPVGCVIAHEGEVIAAAPNERELRGDPTAHCEILALREAARVLGSWRLSGSVVVVTPGAGGVWGGGVVAARGLDAVRRPGAVCDVRGRDSAGADAARRVRRPGSEGRGCRQRARRAG